MIGKVYKITNLDNNKVYIGTTVQPLKNVLSLYQSQYKSYLKNNHKKKVSYYEILKSNNVKIELLKEIVNNYCNFWYDLISLQIQYISEYKSRCVNKRLPPLPRKIST
tara:strand:- start:275 stop:598 length:324 start_codon:yes stop_codon:yes gene_type:complete